MRFSSMCRHLFSAGILSLTVSIAHAEPLQVYGDSIAAGFGASTVPPWPSQCKPAANVYASPGDQAANMAWAVEDAVPNAKTEYALMIGSNDCVAYRDDATKQGYFKAFLLESLVWLLADHKIRGRDSGMSYTGTWDNAYNNDFGKKTTTHGATATAIVSGTAIYLGYVIQDAQHANGTADVFIDDSKVGSLHSWGKMDTVDVVGTINQGLKVAPAAARFGGLRPGSHTVKVIVTSDDGQEFDLNYIGGSDHSAAPTVFLSNIIRMGKNMYSNWAINDHVVDQYNAIIGGLVSDLTRDGFDVTLVDNHSSIDPRTDLALDGAHPNDTGHRKIHDTFAAKTSSCK